MRSAPEASSNRRAIPLNVRVPRSSQQKKSPTDPRHFYAVVKGRHTGIFDNWKAVLVSVSGFAGAKYKSFRHRDSAEEWYLQQLQLQGVIPPERDLSNDDSEDDVTIVYDSNGLPPGAQRPRSAPTSLEPTCPPSPRI
jgi:hypothetical protein